jgi:hypothetical protein
MKTIEEKAEIDSFDKNVICMTMEDFYIRQKIVPSVRKLLVALKQKIETFLLRFSMIWVSHGSDL